MRDVAHVFALKFSLKQETVVSVDRNSELRVGWVFDEQGGIQKPIPLDTTTSGRQHLLHHRNILSTGSLETGSYFVDQGCYSSLSEVSACPTRHTSSVEWMGYFDRFTTCGCIISTKMYRYCHDLLMGVVALTLATRVLVAYANTENSDIFAYTVVLYMMILTICERIGSKARKEHTERQNRKLAEYCRHQLESQWQAYTNQLAIDGASPECKQFCLESIS